MGNNDLSAFLILLHLALDHGVAIGLTTTPKFRGLNGGGYGGCLVFDPKDALGPCNDDLTLTIPGAPLAPKIGYFIIKNSWGPGWG